MDLIRPVTVALATSVLALVLGWAVVAVSDHLRPVTLGTSYTLFAAGTAAGMVAAGALTAAAHRAPGRGHGLRHASVVLAVPAALGLAGALGVPSDVAHAVPLRAAHALVPVGAAAVGLVLHRRVTARGRA